LALVLCAGVALGLSGAPLLAVPATLAPALLALGIDPRPRRQGTLAGGLLAVAVAGWFHADAAAGRRRADCRWSITEGPVDLRGVVGDPEGTSRFRLDGVAGLPGGCASTVRVVGARAGPVPAVGTAVRVVGRWSRSGEPDGRDPLRAGVVLASRVEGMPPRGAPEGPGAADTLGFVAPAASGSSAQTAASAPRYPPAATPRRWASPAITAARVRARAAAALTARLPREGGLAAALVVARQDGLDPTVRDAFVASGTVHLLAISGFHVGVVAMLAVGLTRALGGTRRLAASAGAGVAVTYAAVLGFPDAATRAALLVALAAAGRVAGRPVLGVGALSTALLALVLVDPAALGRVGFQLSFGGAFGLALFSEPCARALRAGVSRALRALGWPSRPLRAEGLAASVIDGVAASVAATALTLPLVAWHFEAVPLLGIPATLVAGPLVAAALPGLLLVGGLEAMGLPGAALPAAGAEALLTATRVSAEAWASLPGAVVPVTRAQVLAAGVGALVGACFLAGSWGLRRSVRLLALIAGGAAGLLLRPVAEVAVRDRSLELHVLDVGQGDALALRTPAGRWVLIDTGPDPGDRLVRALRGLGVRRVALLVITHPDLDHLGGAAEVLAAFEVDALADPGTVRGTAAYREILAAAALEGARWRVVERGDRLDLDDVELRVLHPRAADPPAAGERPVDPNDRSVVVRLEWRGFTALLTGDAPVEAEQAFGPEAGPVDVLKVGHHGSRTSTGQALLDQTRPALALVSLGRFNRFGHPAPEVVARLGAAGIPLHRTDLEGNLSIRVEPTGRWALRVARPGRIDRRAPRPLLGSRRSIAP
jgi:competence protein ComEC